MDHYIEALREMARGDITITRPPQEFYIGEQPQTYVDPPRYLIFNGIYATQIARQALKDRHATERLEKELAEAKAKIAKLQDAIKVLATYAG